MKENAEDYTAYKEKDKERKRASRKRVISPKKASMEKFKCRERVRLCRLKKKLAAKSMPAVTNDMPSEFAYKSPQALGKAEYIEFQTFFQIAQGKKEQSFQNLQNQVDSCVQLKPSNHMAISTFLPQQSIQ